MSDPLLWLVRKIARRSCPLSLDVFQFLERWLLNV